MPFIRERHRKPEKDHAIEQLHAQIAELRRAFEKHVSVHAGADTLGELFNIDALKFSENRDDNVRQIRRRSRSVYVGNDTILCRALGRYKLYISASDIGFGAHLILDGYWEFGITEFIARCVKPGMTVLDLGANYGYYTLLMADLVGVSGKVHAFEPNPYASVLLNRSVEINGFAQRVITDRRAIWDNSGEVLNFRIPKNEPKNARIVLDEKWPSEISDVRVTTVTLDDLPLNNIGFIKADIEGAEQRLWTGMQKLLSSNPEIIFLLEFSCDRCDAPRIMLEQIERVFPLQYLSEDSRVRSITIDEVLQRREDWMLVLTNRNIHELNGVSSAD